MPSGQKNMDNNSYDQLLIIQATIEANRKDSDEKKIAHRRPHNNDCINDGSDKNFEILISQ